MDKGDKEEKLKELEDAGSVDVLPDDEEDIKEPEDSEESEESKKKVSYEPGNIPDGQLDATRLYLSEIGFSPLLSAEEEVKYSRLSLKGDEAARAKMIECNLRLVVKIARRYLNRGLALLDLI